MKTKSVKITNLSLFHFLKKTHQVAKKIQKNEDTTYSMTFIQGMNWNKIPKASVVHT
jgi:hypothetical protein